MKSRVYRRGCGSWDQNPKAQLLVVIQATYKCSQQMRFVNCDSLAGGEFNL
jgi:hypothetical protein